MTPMTLSQIAQATGGRLVGEDRTVAAVATDTRALGAAGDALFVALKGERFDGHDHVEAAARATPVPRQRRRGLRPRRGRDRRNARP